MNTCPTPKVMVFDLDGTLVDSMPWYADVATELLVQHYGLSATQARHDYYQTSGIPFFKQLSVLFSNDPRNVKVAAEFEQRKSLFLEQEGFALSPEVYTTLKKLQANHIKIAISTSNTPHHLEISARRWPIEFDALLGYANESFQKGASHFAWLAEYFNVSLAEILFMGDSLDDYLLTQNTGVGFVAILGSFTAEQFHQLDPNITCIAQFSELLTLLECEN